MGGGAPAAPRTAAITTHFLEDLQWWVATDPQVAWRILRLMEAVLRDPAHGIGKPELLRHLTPGTWSRRITQEHRLVYRVNGTQIDFLQCRYHY